MEVIATLSVHVSGQERVLKGGKALVQGLRLCAVTASCPTLSDPMDRGPPDSSVRGILQASILEWSCYFLLQGLFQT